MNKIRYWLVKHFLRRRRVAKESSLLREALRPSVTGGAWITSWENETTGAITCREDVAGKDRR